MQAITTNAQPHVTMTRDEAQELAFAINEARTLMVRDLRKIDRSRTTPERKAWASAPTSAKLETLTKFYAAHCEAHSIGGY